ncbi:MAG: VOC family protein [Ichthyobacteriaceae bacterium]|nr:VOC family protein [Ichthyobacteriaceae bacterium]
MIKAIDHINISVTNLEVSKEFYIQLLGFVLDAEGELKGEWIDKVVGLKGVRAKYSKLVLPNAETCIELIQYCNPVGGEDVNNDLANQIGMRHIAFNVTEIESLYKKLQNYGVEMFSELQVYSNNGIKNKKLCYFKGPDNVILELAQYY